MSSGPPRRSAGACAVPHCSTAPARAGARAQGRALPARGIVQGARCHQPARGDERGRAGARRRGRIRRQPRDRAGVGSGGRRARRGRVLVVEASPSSSSGPGRSAPASTGRPTSPPGRSSASRSTWSEAGPLLVHPFDDPLVIAGQGTVGLEILEDAPRADVVVVPVGGAGSWPGSPPPSRRVASASSASSPRARRPCCRASKPASRSRSRPRRRERARRAVRRHPRARGVRGTGVQVVTVSDMQIEEGMRRIYADAKLACEPAGAAGWLPFWRVPWRATRSSSSSPGATSGPKSPLVSWPVDEGGHTSRVRRRARHCSCGNEFTTRSTKAELHVEVCSACHPSTRASRS